jgi:hypothetical protein
MEIVLETITNVEYVKLRWKKPFFSFKVIIISPLNLMAFVLEQ